MIPVIAYSNLDIIVTFCLFLLFENVDHIFYLSNHIRKQSSSRRHPFSCGKKKILFWYWWKQYRHFHANLWGIDLIKIIWAVLRWIFWNRNRSKGIQDHQLPFQRNHGLVSEIFLPNMWIKWIQTTILHQLPILPARTNHRVPLLPKRNHPWIKQNRRNQNQIALTVLTKVMRKTLVLRNKKRRKKSFVNRQTEKKLVFEWITSGIIIKTFILQQTNSHTDLVRYTLILHSHYFTEKHFIGWNNFFSFF